VGADRADEEAMNEPSRDYVGQPGGSGTRRVERIAFETDRHLVVGDVTLPSGGYQSRFSDSLNRSESGFVPLTNVKITTLEGVELAERPFVILSKRHIRVAYPVDG
jgi:hypothetical protein